MGTDVGEGYACLSPLPSTKDPGSPLTSAMGGSAGIKPSKFTVDAGVNPWSKVVAKLLRVDNVPDLGVLLSGLSRPRVYGLLSFPFRLLPERPNHHLCLRSVRCTIERRRRTKRRNPRSRRDRIVAIATIAPLEMPC